MRWPWTRREEPKAVYTPVISHLAGFPDPSIDGVSVTQDSALGLSAFWRAVSLISGTLATLPLHSYTDAAGRHKKVPSVFDKPDGDDGQTPFEWKETLVLHLLLWGRAGALKYTYPGGGLARLQLAHPSTWTTSLPTTTEILEGRGPRGGLWFDVRLDTGRSVRLDADGFWYVPAMSLDGRTGESLLGYARRSLSTTMAADRAAGKIFTNGAMVSGIAQPAEDEGDITDDVPEIRRQLNNATGGYEKAGSIAVVNRRLKIDQWTMNAADAQFLQSRQFQVEEISRWTGVPPHLLMQTDKQTSWGTGVEMQDRALGRTVLNTWASRIEGRGSRLLANPRWVEFDFAGLERPTPESEIKMLLDQVAGGLLTLNEAREIRNLPPLPEPAPAPPAPDGDVSRETSDDEPGDDDAPA